MQDTARSQVRARLQAIMDDSDTAYHAGLGLLVSMHGNGVPTLGQLEPMMQAVMSQLEALGAIIHSSDSVDSLDNFAKALKIVQSQAVLRSSLLKAEAISRTGRAAKCIE